MLWTRYARRVGWLATTWQPMQLQQQFAQRLSTTIPDTLATLINSDTLPPAELLSAAVGNVDDCQLLLTAMHVPWKHRKAMQQVLETEATHRVTHPTELRPPPDPSHFAITLVELRKHVNMTHNLYQSLPEHDGMPQDLYRSLLACSIMLSVCKGVEPNVLATILQTWLRLPPGAPSPEETAMLQALKSHALRMLPRPLAIDNRTLKPSVLCHVFYALACLGISPTPREMEMIGAAVVYHAHDLPVKLILKFLLALVKLNTVPESCPALMQIIFDTSTATRDDVFWATVDVMATLAPHVKDRSSHIDQKRLVMLINSRMRHMGGPRLAAVLRVCTKWYCTHPEDMGIDMEQWGIHFMRVLPRLHAGQLLDVLEALCAVYKEAPGSRPPNVDVQEVQDAITRSMSEFHGGRLAMLLRIMSQWSYVSDIVPVDIIAHRLTVTQSSLRSCVPSLLPGVFDSLARLGGVPESFNWDTVYSRLVKHFKNDKFSWVCLCNLLAGLLALTRVEQGGGSTQLPLLFRTDIPSVALDSFLHLCDPKPPSRYRPPTPFEGCGLLLDAIALLYRPTQEQVDAFAAFVAANASTEAAAGMLWAATLARRPLAVPLVTRLLAATQTGIDAASAALATACMYVDSPKSLEAVRGTIENALTACTSTIVTNDEALTQLRRANLLYTHLAPDGALLKGDALAKVAAASATARPLVLPGPSDILSTLTSVATRLKVEHVLSMGMVDGGLEVDMVCRGRQGRADVVVDVVAWAWAAEPNLADGLSHAEHVLLRRMGVPLVVVWEGKWRAMTSDEQEWLAKTVVECDNLG